MKKGSKKSPLLLPLKMIWTAIFMIIIFKVISSNYALFIDTQDERCLPYKYYLFNKNISEITKGEIYSFKSHGIELFDNGVNFGKIVVGVSGDKVNINKYGVFINDKLIDESPLVHAKKLNKKESVYYTEYVIPENKFFMFGSMPKSYDSRYYGLVDKENFTGRLYPVW